MQRFVRGVIRRNDKYLVIKEYKHENYNVWNFPGGKLDDDENLEDACEREILEELGLEIFNLKLFHQAFYSYPFFGDWDGYYFLCDVKNPDDIKIMEPENCDGFCWLKADEIKKLAPLGLQADLLEKI